MKKYFLLISLLLISFATVAHAESIKLGGKTIQHEIPRGYVSANGGKYTDTLAIMRRMQPEDIQIHSMYVPVEVDKNFTGDATSNISKFLTINSVRPLHSQNLSTGDFKELKSFMTKNYGKMVDSGEIQKEITSKLNQETGGQVQLGTVKPLGTFGASDTQISAISLVTVAVMVEGKQVPFEQLMLQTQILVEGKLLIINQYMPANDPDAGKFRDQALATVNSLKFNESGAKSSSNTFKKQSTIWDYIKIGLIGAIIGGLGAGIATYIKKKKGGTDQNSEGQQASKPDLQKVIKDIRNNLKNLFNKNKR